MKNWTEIESASNTQILDWAAAQPWARKMAACQQDDQWHVEGDVWTHTKMVYAELERLADWRALDRVRQVKLLLTTLLHDSGKPATTNLNPETGRTNSPKHAIAGTEITRRVLRELGCGLVTREEIAALVRFHGRPAYLLEKQNPEFEVISLSWLVDNQLLYNFAVADTRGRKTKEMNRPEENVHLWKMIAEERGCFNRPYEFANDQARFLFYRNQLSSLNYMPHESFRCTATLLSGLPGAGKDTWLTRNRPTLPVVALDAVRDALDVEPTDDQGEVIQKAREQCREHLRSGTSFVFNATNITRRIRQRWIDLFADYGARIEIVYLEPALETILAQNRRRSKIVPENVIMRLLEKLEVPTLTECHSLTIV